MIPKTIYMCDKSLDYIKMYSQNWQRLNPEYKIELYDDARCEEFLLNEFGAAHRDTFRFIPHGPIKACFWRACIVFKYGGIYVDADIEPIFPIKDFLEDIDFVTCSDDWKFKYNPDFLGANAGDEILGAAIDLYVKKEKDKYGYWAWSSPQYLSEAMFLLDYRGKSGVYYRTDGARVQILESNSGKDKYDAHRLYNGVRIFNNRYKSWDRRNHRFAK